MIIVMGELRRFPVGKEFPRCGEEYIPYYQFQELGGTVVSSSDNNEVFESKNGRVMRYPVVRVKGPLRTMLSDRRVRGILEKEIIKEKPEIVNFHTFLPQSMEFVRSKGIPVVLTSHGGHPAFRNFPFWKRPLARIRKWVEKSAVKKANLLVAINRYLIDEYETYGAGKPVKLIYSGVDTKRFRPAQKWSGRLNVVYLSRLNGQKGVWDFIKMARSSGEHDFTIIGYDGCGVSGKIRKLIAGRGNISFHPNASEKEKQELLGKGHVFVSLSKGYDPTPNVIYEAMGSGMAMVSTLKGYREEVLGDNCLWVSGWEEVLALLEDRKDLKKRGKRFRQMAEEKFNTRRMAKEYKEIAGSL